MAATKDGNGEAGAALALGLLGLGLTMGALALAADEDPEERALRRARETARMAKDEANARAVREETARHEEALRKLGAGADTRRYGGISVTLAGIPSYERLGSLRALIRAGAKMSCEEAAACVAVCTTYDRVSAARICRTAVVDAWKWYLVVEEVTSFDKAQVARMM